MAKKSGKGGKGKGGGIGGALGDMLGGDLSQATLSIYNPPTGDSKSPGGLIKMLEFQFNPNELSLSRRSTWKHTAAAAVHDSPPPEFISPEPRSLDVEVFLDRSEEPDSNDVMKDCELLLKCCEVTTKSIAAKRPSTPWVKFEWGSFSTVSFNAYVGSVDVSYTLFAPSGTPIRATCRLHLEEIPGGPLGQNPTSGALTAQRVHRVVAGDSLQSLAWREYGNANAWRAIAEANDIDDPSRLPPGVELMLPAAEEVGA
ncbi:LysM peptidoglycan-binding domain-containing protein [Streptomyces sp. Ru87]|uniref:CIS tube protein n=1 Tax=Streptomyces sp. Ru87 TaxID=2044307 RepID=UPI000D1E5A15|nr:LysM peptidoglycan-binding domain-containing protein [Streptomyces sp. Ru87]